MDYKESIMIARFIESFIRDDQARDCYVDVLAGLPRNF